MRKLAPVTSAHPQSRLATLVKQTVGGKVALAAWRQRRRPTLTRQTRRLRSAEMAPPVDAAAYGGLFMVPVGPGEWAELSDTLASIVHYEPDAKVVVVADGAVDIEQQLLTAQFPQADLLRPPLPSGGPPRLTPAFAWAMREIAEHYRFDVLCKIDSDALVTGPGLIEAAAGRFAVEPRLGQLGSTAIRADGEPSDPSYTAWVLGHERRWSRRVRRTVEQAERNGWHGEAHGGVYLVSRPALDELVRGGFLDQRPPLWSLIPEDVWLSLGIQGAGFEIGSWGAPGDPIASGQGFLPIAKEEVLERDVRAIHSVRRGIGGEDEEQLRTFFRSVREQDRASSPA